MGNEQRSRIPRPFSPLIVGSKVVTAFLVDEQKALRSFSPLIVGSKVVTKDFGEEVFSLGRNFQSPNRRV